MNIIEIEKVPPLYLKVNVGFLGGWGAVLWVYLGLGSW